MQKLSDETQKYKFQQMLDEIMQQEGQATDIEEQWKLLYDAIIGAAQETLAGNWDKKYSKQKVFTTEYQTD